MANLATISNNILADSGIDPINLIVGTGTVNYIPKFTGEDTIAVSQITDNGTTVSIGNASAANTTLAIKGDWVSGYGTVRAYPVTAMASGGSAGYTIFDSNGTTRLAFFAVNSSRVELWGQQNTSMIFATNNSEKMYLTAGGNLGINQSNPGAKLEIYPGSISASASQEIIRLDVPGSDIFSAATGYINFRGFDVSNGTQRDVAYIGAQLVPNTGSTPSMGANLVFSTCADGVSQTPQQRLIITSNGLVGINTSPLTLLDIGTGASNALGIGNVSTTISSGDLLGAISFISRDTSTYSSGGVAGIRSYATATYNTGNVSADLRFYVSNSLQNTTASVLFGTERMRLKQDGVLNLSAYGAGSITGTRAYDLAVDSSGNIIEVAVGAGTVTGSGTTNYITKWSGSSSVTNSGITDDGTTITTAEALYLTGTSGYNITSNSDIIMANAKPVRGYTTGGSGWRLISIENDNKIYIAGNGGDIIMNGGGNLGVGTTTPTSTSNQGIEIFDDSNGGTLSLSRNAGNQRGIVRFGRNNGGSFQTAARITGDSTAGSGASGNLYFETANSAGAQVYRMIMLSSGRIAINDTSANGQLQITGGHIGGYGILNINSADAAIIALDSSTTYDVRIRLKYQGNDKWFAGMAPAGDDYTLESASGTRFSITQAGAATFSSSVTANSFIKSGGTSAQYLKADGSVSTLTNPVTGTGVTQGVAYWSSTSEITAESDFSYDAANNRVRINSNAWDTAGAEAKLIVSGVLSAGSSAVAQFNGFIRIKDQLLIHNGANTAQDAYIQAVGQGVLTVGNTLLINTTTNVSGFNLQIDGNTYIGSKLSVGTTYNGFTANIAGITYIIGGSVWTQNGYGYTNSGSTNTGMFPDSGHNIDFKSNNASALYINSTRNVGIGTTPDSWSSSWRALQVGAGSAIAWTGAGANDFSFSTNSFFDSSDNRWEYRSTGDGAARYSMTALTGQHRWFTAPIGTAGAAISFTQVMTLFENGDLAVGATSSNNSKLRVVADWISGYSTVGVQGASANQAGYGLYNIAGTRVGVWAYTGSVIYFETETSGINMNFNPAGITSMTLHGDGNVSIGRNTSGVTQSDIYLIPSSANSQLYFGRLSSTNDDNTKVYFQNRVGTAAMFVNTGGQQVGIRTTSPQRSLHLAAGGYFLLGGNLYNSYTSDGLWGATATPNFIQTTAYGGTYSFNGGGGLVLGYEDNGAGLYSPAYGFEVKSTDGIPVAGRVVRSIVMKDIDRNTFPLIIYNNGKTFMGEGAGYGRLDVSTSTNEAICVGVNSNTVSSGDLIGALSFVSRDGSTYSAGGVANIRSYATATYNTGNVSADLRFYVSESLQNTGNVPLFGTERMRIHSNGRVAVGDSVETANGILQVRGAHVSGYGLINMNSTDSCILSMDSSGSYDIRVRYKYNGGDKWYVGMRLGDDYEIRNSTDALAVKVNQSADIFMPNRLQVGSTGGFSSSSAKFLVGDIISSGSGAIAQFNGFLRIRSQLIIHRDSNTAQETYLECTGNAALTTGGSITATSFFESSDIRLKSNINDFSIDVTSIKAKIYEKDGKVEIGYLAQDVEGILDSAISKRENGYLDLSYRQVHTAKIAALEQRIKELEEQLKNK